MCVQFFTHSGSRYQLGRPAPWYLEELVQRNYWNEEDPLNPLMVRTDFVLKTSGAFLRTRGPSVLKAEGTPCLLTSDHFCGRGPSVLEAENLSVCVSGAEP